VAANQTWAVDFIHDSLINGLDINSLSVLLDSNVNPRGPVFRVAFTAAK
jgi:hypothetical protein